MSPDSFPSSAAISGTSGAHHLEALADILHPNRRTLGLVVGLHLLENALQALALLVAALGLRLTLPYGPLWAVVAFFFAWNLLAAHRTWRADPDEDLAGAFSWQLGVAIGVLTALLYFSGGATSPFVSLYLLPLVIGALCLSAPRAALLGLFAATGYTALLFYHVPLQAQHMGGAHAMGFHVIGMWINFLVSAVIITGVVSLLATAARARAEALARLREAHLRDRHVIAIGGMAASAAHALSTPLSTVAVVLDELAEDGGLAPEQHDSLALARAQIEQCRARLGDILAAGGHKRLSAADCADLHAALDDTLATWRLQHPDMRLQVHNGLPRAPALLPPFFADGIGTLLDNAAEANRSRARTGLSLRAESEDGILRLELTDEGGGPAPALDALPVESRKAGRSGTGLTILASNLRRTGGILRFAEHEEGCTASLHLPLPQQQGQPD
jgi:two-component system sensor histidine kinase RegB